MDAARDSMREWLMRMTRLAALYCDSLRQPGNNSTARNEATLQGEGLRRAPRKLVAAVEALPDLAATRLNSYLKRVCDPSDAAAVGVGGEQRELVETASFDAKAELPDAKRNIESPRTLAAMATDGGGVALRR